jgi:ubiquinone/menaquinone biosynthesis C-methylase UbiE
MAIATAPDLTAITQRQQRVWSAGDFSRVGTLNVLHAELLCESLDLLPGERVLDVAAGSGNASLAAARRFCEVTATDFVPELLELAERRAALERLPLTVRVADAQDLPFPAESFDVVISTFGAMFAPDQERTARELLRVCRAGGRIGMNNWHPESFIGDVFRTIASHVAPSPGLRSPLEWGSEQRIRDLFGAGVHSLRLQPREYVWRFVSPEHMLDYFQRWYGPTTVAFAALEANAQEGLARDLLGVYSRHNRAGDAALVAPSAYVEVTAVKA